MRPTPIFDTNIFGHVQDGSIPQKDWRFLLAHRPGHGWPLSSVTAVELLGGIHEDRSEKFVQQKEQVELACKLSKGRIHEEPRFLICQEVLHRPLPPEVPRLDPQLLGDYMTVVRCAKSLEELLSNRVQVNRLQTRGQGHAGTSGFKPSVLVEGFIRGPKREWLKRSEAFADETYPRWREHLQETGKRLPDEQRKQLEFRLASDAERVRFAETVLRWLGATAEPESVADMAKRLDAVMEFTIFVDRQIAGNYNLEKHESDVYDQFQLHHLAIDRFIIVSEDRNLRTRTARSSQARRIVSFDEFLRSI